MPVSYTRSYIDYQNCYFNQSDYSKVLYENNKPIGVWSGVIGGKHFPPIFIVGISEKVQKKAIDSLLYEEKDGLTTAVDYFMNRQGISLWHKKLIDLGAKVEVKYDLFVDLSLSEEEIWRSFAEGHRESIKKAKKKFVPVTWKECSNEIIQDFRKLHIQDSGRETRSLDTWLKQKNAVNNDEAFIDFLYFQSINDFVPIIVGASLFHYSKSECYYAVNASNEEFKQRREPMSHLLLWEAIKYAKSLGIKYFNLGEYHLDGTDKEKSISQFKAGFCTNIFCRYEFKF